MSEKLRPLLPTLKEKKRYLAFEVVSEQNFSEYDINNAILSAKDSFLGIYLSAKAGVQIIKQKFDKKTQSGVIRVNRKYTDHMKTALGLIKEIKNHDAIIRTINVSGVLRKAKVEKDQDLPKKK
ncbi:hypothetical protein BVX95_01900 [archaeon D22]|nr:hypothetical protein BVX95_01900 [archaeon D22]